MRSVLVLVDVDGTVSPVHTVGTSTWTDDEEVGNVLGPVTVSAALVRHLDGLAAVPGVECRWLTSWSPEMRAAMSLFPGLGWPEVPHGDALPGRRGWWKVAALHAWLTERQSTAREERWFGAVVWLDDDLRSPARQAACRRRLEPLGVELLMVAPRTEEGLTPQEVVRVGEWLKKRIEKPHRLRPDEAWRTSPVAPCACGWDGYHCPHCGLVTDPAGDAWYPFHTLRCHDRAAAIPVERGGLKR